MNIKWKYPDRYVYVPYNRWVKNLQLMHTMTATSVLPDFPLHFRMTFLKLESRFFLYGRSLWNKTKTIKGCTKSSCLTLEKVYLTDTCEITYLCQYLKLLVKKFLTYNLISVTIFILLTIAEFQLKDNRNLCNCELSTKTNIMQVLYTTNTQSYHVADFAFNLMVFI